MPDPFSLNYWAINFKTKPTIGFYCVKRGIDRCKMRTKRVNAARIHDHKQLCADSSSLLIGSHKQVVQMCWRFDYPYSEQRAFVGNANVRPAIDNSLSRRGFVHRAKQFVQACFAEGRANVFI